MRNQPKLYELLTILPILFSLGLVIYLLVDWYPNYVFMQPKVWTGTVLVVISSVVLIFNRKLSLQIFFFVALLGAINVLQVTTDLTTHSFAINSLTITFQQEFGLIFILFVALNYKLIKETLKYLIKG